MIQRQLPDPAGIGVLGDVALPALVDQDAADQLLGIDEDRDLGGVHVGEVGAERLRHPDRLAVVLFHRRRGSAGDARCVLGHHRLVVGEAAHREHHSSTGSDVDLGAVLAGADPHHPAVVDDECLHPHVVAGPRARGGGRLDERLHQHEAGAGLALLLVLHLRDVAARGRGRDGVERVGVLPAAVHQPLVAHRFPAGLGEELRFEHHSALDQPVEVRDAVLAVVGDAFLVGTRTHGRVQERGHVLDGIGEAASLLDRGAAAQVDEAAGHRGRPAPGSGAFEHQHVGTVVRRLDRRRGAGDAVAGDHHVGLVVPGRDRRHRNGRHRHGFMALGRSLTHSWPQ